MSGRPLSEYETIIPIPSPEVENDDPRLSRSLQPARTTHKVPVTPSLSLSNPTTLGCQPSIQSRPPLQRGQSQIQAALSYVILPTEAQDESERERAKWNAKRLRHCSRNYAINEQQFIREVSIDQGGTGDVYRRVPPSPAISHTQDYINSIDPTTSSSNLPHLELGGNVSAVPRSRSQSTEGRQPRIERRDSVLRTVYDSFAAFVKRGTTMRQKPRLMPLVARCSFDIEQLDAKELEKLSSAEGDFSELIQHGYDISHNTARSNATVAADRRKSYADVIEEETSMDLSEEQSWSRSGSLFRRKPNSSAVIREEDEDDGETNEGIIMRVMGGSSPKTKRKDKQEASSSSDNSSGIVKRPSNLSSGGRPVLERSSRVVMRSDDGEENIRREERREESDRLSYDITTQRAQADSESEIYPVVKPRHSFAAQHGSLPPPIVTSKTSRAMQPRSASILSDEVFFDVPLSPVVQPDEMVRIPPLLPLGPIREEPEDRSRAPTFYDAEATEDDQPQTSFTDLLGDSRPNIPLRRLYLQPSLPERSRSPDRPIIQTDGIRQSKRGKLEKQNSIDDWRASDPTTIDGIYETLMRSSVTQQPRDARVRGIGVFGRMIGRRLGKKKVTKLSAELRAQIERGEDERPFFTWWITVVQILICIISITSYGLGPNGMLRVQRKEEVKDVSLTPRHVSYYEPANLWIGPKFSDLIRLGAKYSPCMRREHVLWENIADEQRRENKTGCCIFNDKAGCYQSGKESCPTSIATWYKWKKRRPLFRSKSESDLNRNEHGAKAEHVLLALIDHSHRSAGAVCGQDPDFCRRPASVDPHPWKDDLTQWPICEESYPGNDRFSPHLTCELTGRPCCIQLQGQCRIATRDYCDFVQGHYHENATLCSQVNCFSDICGMLPFFDRSPDQIYRLFISLFVHAGLIHLLITVVFQLWVMRDLEMMIGWSRMAILYFVSGTGGNLASAIFVPYNPEVGPSGSQLGILAALLVDAYHHRYIIDHPWKAYQSQLAIVLFQFAAGLLPWIDNWAHLFGFIFGLLITLVIFPYLDFMSPEDKQKQKQQCISLSIYRRQITVVVSLVLCILLFIILLYIFLSGVQFNCTWCEYFNCINIKWLTQSDHFCDNRGQSLSQWLPI